MKLRSISGVILACMLFFVQLCIPVNAAEVNCDMETVTVQEIVMPRATESFSMSIPSKTKAKGNAFSLMEGELVTIKASYIPFSASVDIGIVDSDGIFYYINTTSGSFDETISVSKTDQYKLQIRNNSTETIDISGHINF